MDHEIANAATTTSTLDHSDHMPSHAPLRVHEGHEPSGHGSHDGHGGGHGKHAGHHVEMFRRRFSWTCC
jgi:P-type Cu2+ transporter